MLVGAMLGHSSAFILGGSSLSEKVGNFVAGNCAFTNDAPARNLITKIDNGRGHVPRRISPVDDDVEAALELVAHLFRAGAFRGPAQVCGSSSDRDGRRRNHGARNLRIGYA